MTVSINFLAWLVAGTGMILVGKGKAGINIYKGLLWFITNQQYIGIKRAKVRLIRKVSDRDLHPMIFRRVPLSYYINRLLTYFKVGLHG